MVSQPAAQRRALDFHRENGVLAARGSDFRTQIESGAANTHVTLDVQRPARGQTLR